MDGVVTPLTRGPERLRIVIPGQAAGAGSKTGDPIMRNNPAFSPSQPEGPGNYRKVPVLDSDSGRPLLRMRHMSKFTEPWMEYVTLVARTAWKSRPMLEGAAWLEIDCYEARPAAHFRSSGLRPDAPARPSKTRTADSGKLRRAIEDALSGVVWRDDKQVVDGADRKHYCDDEYPRACAVVSVGLMAAQTAADAGLATPAPAGQESLLAA